MPRSDLNSEAHSACEITAQSGHVFSSPEPNILPIAALLPNTSKKFGETRALVSRTTPSGARVHDASCASSPAPRTEHPAGRGFIPQHFKKVRGNACAGFAYHALGRAK